ncbi:MAG: hypothetical protein KGZ34_06300 [Nitrosarchaeum sp.]|nr:hypothetical protein [Nitrosarchaeum sp.]
MEIHSTLLYKQRDKIQIHILRKIATDGKHSKKSLEIELEKHHPVIDNAVKQLLKKNFIVKTYGSLTDKPGQPQKFYRLTEKGILVLIDEIKIPLDEFWKMLFRIFNSKGIFYSSESVNSKKKFVNERNIVLKNITIEQLIKKYENNVLGYKREYALSHIYQKIPDVQFLAGFNFSPSEKLIIETIALYGSLSLEELSIKLSKRITIPQKLLHPYFLIKKLDNKKYDITILGIQYVIFVIFKQLKHDSQMQKMRILIENQKIILPLIFRKWVWLTKFFSNRELFNALIDAIDTNQRQLPFQTDSGIQEILDSHRNLEEVYNRKIKQEYEVGSKIRYEIAYNIAHLTGFHSKNTEKNYEKNLEILSSLLNDTSVDYLLNDTSGDYRRNVEKPFQLVIDELDKLNALLGFESVELSLHDEMKKQRLVEYERIKSDSLSFRFYSILLSQIYQKKEEPDKWSNFLKMDQDIMPWYSNWIKEIGDFEGRNIEYRNNLLGILSHKVTG